MRAVIRCCTRVEKQTLLGHLSKLGWTPDSFAATDIDNNKNKIIDALPEDRREVVRHSFVSVIYHEPTNTWGIVNATTGRCTFRLVNAIAGRLTTACEKLVKDMEKNRRKYILKNYNFSEMIEVVEATHDMHSFSGTIVSNWAVREALKYKKPEFMIGNLSVFLSAALFFISSPWYDLSGLLQGDDNTYKFLLDTAQRLDTALFLTAVISYTQVFLYWLGLRKERPIQWTVTK